jgi:hypothetical protein
MSELELIPESLLEHSLRDLIRAAPLPGLAAEPTCTTTCDRIERFLQEHALSSTLQAAALWLLAGELDRSHAVSQNIKSAEGAFWHGIMHRREGDFWNSKYWFRQCPRHAVHRELAATIDRHQSEFPVSTDKLLNPDTLPDILVDLIEQTLVNQNEQGRRGWIETLQLIQWWEWQLLLKHSMQ